MKTENRNSKESLNYDIFTIDKVLSFLDANNKQEAEKLLKSWIEVLNNKTEVESKFSTEQRMFLPNTKEEVEKYLKPWVKFSHEEPKIETKAVTDSRNLFTNIDRHFELMETSEDYVNCQPKFNVGQRMFLEIEVVNPNMTSWLNKWLYSTDKNKERIIPFGCNLDIIHFNDPSGIIFKQKLIDFSDTL